MNAYLAARNLRDGQYTIVAEYSNKPRIKRISTGVKVAEKYWDAKSKLVRANGTANVTKTNNHLKAVLSGLNEAITALYVSNGNVLPTVDQLNAHMGASAVAQAEAAQPETELVDMLSNYLEGRTRWQEATRKNFRTLLANIRAYQKANGKTWLLSTISNAEIDSFQNWLLKEFNYQNSTLAKRVRLLKQFLTEHDAPGINREKVKALHKQLLARPVVLSKAEIQALIDLPLLPNTRLGDVRNMQVLQIFTGLRYGDLIRLRSHHVQGKYINIREEKTGQTRQIPIFPQAQAVLDIYTDAESGSFTLPAISNQKFNQYLAEIIADLPCLQKEIMITTMERDTVVEKWEAKHLHIRSHSSRRTFCSLLLSMGYSIPETMELSGHKSLVAFQRYMGQAEKRKDAVADFAARWQML